jgi:hypothetical protein
MAERKSARHYSVLKRVAGITPLQQMEKKMLVSDIRVVMMLIEETGVMIQDDIDDNVDVFDLEAYENLLYDYIGLLFDKLAVLTVFVDVVVPPILPRNLVLDALEGTNCTIDYRFTYSELVKLIGVLDGDFFNGLLRLPKLIHCNNRTKVRGDTAFLYLLRKHVIFTRLVTDAQCTVGREYSQCSRIFAAASQWLYDTWRWRITDQRQFAEFWTPKLETFNLLIRRKYMDTYHIGIPLRYEDVAMLYDCHFYPTCKPTNFYLENATYNHYEKKHGIKVGSLVGAGGMCLHLSTTYLGRHNDVFVQNQSNVNEMVRDAQVGNVRQFKIYEDKAFHDKSHCRAKYNNRLYQILHWQEVVNANMDTILTMVEWKFGRNSQYFSTFCDKKRLKIAESPILWHVTNQFFLDNLLACCRGTNNMQYLNCINTDGFPSIEEYLGFIYRN